MPTIWSQKQTGGVRSLSKVYTNANGLNECLGNANALTNNGSVTTVTLPDGLRTAWRFTGESTQNLTAATLTLTGFYCATAIVRFIFHSFETGQSTVKIGQFGNVAIFNLIKQSDTVARLQGQAINGQNLPIQQAGGAGTVQAGVEYCAELHQNYSTSTMTLYLDGTSVASGTITGSWTANASITATPQIGENPAQAQRGTVDVIEMGLALGTAAAPAMTPTQIAAVAAADCFMDMTRPTHPGTSPLTFTTRIMGGYPTQIHDVSLMRSNGANSDTPVSKGAAQRTGPGTVSVADSSPGTGRKFYYLSVSSTGSVSTVSTHYGGSSPQPGGKVRGVDPIPSHPTTGSFGAVSGGCPIIAVLGDSRTPTQSQLNTGYRIMRGGGTDNVLTLGAPGSGWNDWLDSSSNVVGTYYPVDGSSSTTTSYHLKTKFLTEAIAASVEVVVVLLAVNDSRDPTDTAWQDDVQEVIGWIAGAGMIPVFMRDPGHENLNSTMQNIADQEAYIASYLAGVGGYYSNDGLQQYVAAWIDTISTDGTHIATGTVGGLAANQILANYMMLAAQTAIAPTAILSINTATGTIEPDGTLVRTLTLLPTNGFTGPVTLAATGLPTGVTVAFSPTSPVNIPSSSSVNVTMTLTAANNAPLIDDVDILITATANGLDSSVHLLVDVIDVTAPQVSSVVINGASVTVTMNSLVTGNAGLSFYENGGLVTLSGSLTNVDGLVLTGTLSTAFTSGTTGTWNYSQATGNIIDAGGNEVANASGQPATNNTPGASGGAGWIICGGPIN